jgi:hypothetical protein
MQMKHRTYGRYWELSSGKVSQLRKSEEGDPNCFVITGFICISKQSVLHCALQQTAENVGMSGK